MDFRPSISHKLFAAFLLILVIVVGAIFLARYIFFFNFRTYIHQVEAERLQALVPELQQEYSKSKNWKNIRSNQHYWHKVLNTIQEVNKGIPPPPGDEFRKGKGPEVLLSDAQLQPVVGTPEPDDLLQLVAVKIEGQVVGWLGLKKMEPLHSGPPAALIKRQTQHLFILGLIVVGLTGMIAYLVSRHMVKSIRELTRGTRELANRNFQVLVETDTHDEFGELANHFNTMAQTLERYENMRQQWLTDISHELRTPLAVLRGEVEALYDGIREASPENFASLLSEIVRLSTLVEDLHQLSLADSYRFCLEKSPLDLHALIRESVAGCSTRLQKEGIEVLLNFARDRKLWVPADSVRLRQVIGNVLDNCCKYINKGGSIAIRTRFDEQNALIIIEDSGPGVSQKELGKIFDRLYRAENSRNRQFGGSGLGLSICRQIVEAHGGSIWAEMSERSGLAIYISLPGR